jgi:hypothetical protein
MSSGTAPTRLLIASIGLILAIAGLTLLVMDIVNADAADGWRGQSLYDVMTSPWMDYPLLQDLAAWLRHPQALQFLNPPVSFVLDLIPRAFLVIAIGVLIAWKALK